MNYIIIDLEWNQSPNRTPVEGMPFEIIEIGAVKLNEKLEYVDSFHRLITPTVYPYLHRITHQITSISMSDFTSQPTFTDAVTDLLKWCDNDYLFCTWGSMDLTELQRNMHYYSLPLLPFPVYYYDVQKLFSLSYDDGKSRNTLEYAVEYLSIPKQGSFHRAIDDAIYTAEVLKQMDFSSIISNFSIDSYQLPDSRKNEIYAYYDTYSKFISRGFDSKSEAMLDKSVIATPCHICKKKLKKKIRWFSGNSRMYYCLAFCPEHGYLKGKIRMKKHDSGKYYVVKTLKPTDENGAKLIYDKQLDIRKKRRDRRHNMSAN